MIIPKTFYYEEAQSKKGYTQTPTGNFDVSQLINAKPYWILPILPREKKQKKLILSDWTANFWSDDKRSIVCDRLKELLAEGFTLYCWSNDKLTPITSDNLSTSLSAKNLTIKPTYPTQIYNAAAQENLNYDQIQLLDDHQIECLCTQNDVAPYTLQLSHLSRLNDSLDRQKILEILDQAKPPLMEIIHDEFSDAVNKFIPIVNETFPHLTIKTHYKSIVCDENLIQWLLSNLDTSNLPATIYHSRNAQLTIDQFITAESWKINQVKISSKCILSIWSANPNLKQFHLINCRLTDEVIAHKMDPAVKLRGYTDELTVSEKLRNNYITGNFLLAAGSLPHLELINLDGCFANDEFIQQILTAAPYLKQMNLSNCQNITGDFSLTAKSLPSLELIELSSCSINDENLQQILTVAPNLKKVSLYKCMNITGNFSLTAGSLPSLELIHLHSCSINDENLQQILTAAPHLKKMDLTNCQNITGDFSLTAKDLPYLEEIDLNSCSINDQGLQQILTAAPHLKKVTLYHCMNITGNFSLTAGSLPSLELIDIHRCSINEENLQQILTAAPNLKKMDLTDCQNITGDFSLSTGSLPFLEEIDLSKCSINDENLQQILTAAPHVKKMDLTDCQNITGDFSLLTGSLPILEEIDLSKCSINDENLQQILTAAPHLKKVTLYDCINITGNFSLIAKDLPNLEEIDLNGCSINDENLKQILTAAPHLKIVTLDFCENITGNFLLDAESLPDLEEIYLTWCSSINDQGLQQILTAAPNLSPRAREEINGRLKKRLKNPDGIASQTMETTKKFPLEPQSSHHGMTNFKPHSKDKPFQFTGQQNEKNQAMIIEKLSQYLTLTKQSMHAVSRIQDGMCTALVHFFNDNTREQWDCFLDTIWQWNGSTSTITTGLKKAFDQFYPYVDTHQLNSNGLPRNFIGENLRNLLNSISIGECIILGNPWHVISVRRNEKNYELYNPNAIEVKEIRSTLQLTSRIVYSIGSQVSIEGAKIALEPIIKNLNDFLETGGLLSLSSCANYEQILSKIPLGSQFTKEALQGLFLRNMRGVPAWVMGVNHQSPEVRALTSTLLEQYKAITPDSKEKLKQSVADIPAMEKQKITTKVTESHVEHPHKVNIELEETLLDLLRSFNKEKYEQQLITWEPAQSRIATVLEYCQHRISGVDALGKKAQKQLIKLASTAQLNGLAGALQQYCITTQRPVFYIDNPENLICSAPFVSRDEANIGHMRPAPGGMLFNFLKEHEHSNSSPVLIINYEQFKADDLVRFNGLLDANPHADGIPLPFKTIVIGLQNVNHPHSYDGSDFRSRFDTNEQCPFEISALQSFIPAPLLKRSPDDTTPKAVINLYHAPDWQTRLLGRWRLDKDTLEYEEGELQSAIHSGHDIEIQNGLWQDETFVHFWQQIRQGGIYHADRLYHLPQAISVVQSEGYDWERLKARLIIKQGLSTDPVQVLNYGTIGHFFSRYTVNDEEKSLHYQPGFIQIASGSLVVNVTLTLTEDTWAMLLIACQKSAIDLIAHCAPGVTLPKPLADLPAPIPEPTIIQWEERKTVEVIASSDIDTTVTMLTRQGDWQVIDVSECQPNDLFHQINAAFDKEKLQFTFTQLEGILFNALAANTQLVLKGHFSAVLIDSLAPLLIEREQKPCPGKLILVTKDAHSFSFFPHAVHDVSSEDKLSCLQQYSKEILETLHKFLNTESLSKLQARGAYLQLNPQSDSLNAWQGMFELLDGVVMLDEPLDVALSAEQARKFTEMRRAAVTQVLSNGPCVFLTGLSGVGKTTFIEREFCTPESGYQLFSGEGQIKHWAGATNEGMKLLFLDEANLSHREWSEFEGLFQHQPGILIEGTFYSLSPHHKVVFAGNPIKYGDERRLAAFFQRHGSAMLFEPLPKAVIYEKILKPIFEQQDIDAIKVQAISNLLLDAYALICKCSKTEVLISPRELQMMALLTLCHYHTNPQITLEAHAKTCVYALGKSLIPTQEVQALRSFERQFKPMDNINPQTTPLDEDFLITPSRQAIVERIQERLQLRDWRIAHANTLNEEQQYGGLGGLILEGEPGIGKSELVIRVLRAAGYQKQHINDLTRASSDEKPFYIMPVSMALTEKIALLSKAFHEGAVVLIDEINSSPMMEKFLNALLMGRDPETNARPKNPGFMIIGTQNPATMPGRRLASTALLRRMTTCLLTEYLKEEMISILTQKQINPIEATAMVEAFQKQQSYAKKHHLQPAPCFRDLLKLAHSTINTKPTLKVILEERPLPQPIAREPVAREPIAREPVRPELVLPEPVTKDLRSEKEKFEDALANINTVLNDQNNQMAKFKHARKIVIEIARLSQHKKVPYALFKEILTATTDAIQATDSTKMMQSAMTCAELGKRIGKNAKLKLISGLLVGLVGALIIAASITVAIASYGVATPLSAIGISLGVSYMTAGIAIGTGAIGAVAVTGVVGRYSFFNRERSKQGIKNASENLATELSKIS